MAGVAVSLDLLAAIPGDEICTRHWVSRNLVVRVRRKFDERRLSQASEFCWTIVAFFQIRDVLVLLRSPDDSQREVIGDKLAELRHELEELGEVLS